MFLVLHLLKILTTIILLNYLKLHVISVGITLKVGYNESLYFTQNKPNLFNTHIAQRKRP